MVQRLEITALKLFLYVLFGEICEFEQHKERN